jgi:Fic family protein
MITERKYIKEMLHQSNLIEGIDSKEADEDAYDAWKFAEKKEVITVADILYIHKILMRRQNPRIAGKIRDCDVFIGGKRKIFISESLIKADLQMKVCFEMIAKGNFNKDGKTRQVHIAFEGIHPFEDGNGRVGRILYNWHRLKLGMLLFIIHVGDEQQDYYSWFS